MGRMTITIDEELVTEVKKVSGATTKAAAIRLALRDFLRRQRLADVLDHQGQIELDLNQETLKKLREDG